jgi:Zn-dependent protease with chaperone function
MSSRLNLPLPSLPSLLLYVLTFAVEVPVILTRMLIAWVLLGLVLLLSGHSTASALSLASYLALIPTAWSLIALVTPLGGGWWWRANLGGRKPSEREQAAYQDAIELLQAHTDGRLPVPSGWFVLDDPQPDAAVCGSTLMLSRGLLETDHLPGVLAHELGHLATPDGRLTAALNRLVIKPPPVRSEPKDEQRADVMILANDRIMLGLFGLRALARLTGMTCRFARGGLGLRVTAPAWGAYWRAREYKADEYATSLGQADELADFLEIHALIHDHPVPFLWLTEHTHPPTELRVDKLRNSIHTQAPMPGGGATPPAAPDTRPLTA